jgi:TRAP-type C4-dicarboxylate transport system permease small subunit
MKYSWWFLQVIMIFISIFFTIFGIDLIIGAYSINNPFTFIMIFFSASLIILISLTLLLGFIIKIVRMYKYLKKENSVK